MRHPWVKVLVGLLALLGALLVGAIVVRAFRTPEPAHSATPPPIASPPEAAEPLAQSSTVSPDPRPPTIPQASAPIVTTQSTPSIPPPTPVASTVATAPPAMTSFPSLYPPGTPSQAKHLCVAWIQECMATTRKIDECVYAAPRCGPGRVNPAAPCCAAKCVDDYRDARARGVERSNALDDLHRSACHAR